MIAKSLVSAWSIRDTAYYDYSKYYCIRIYATGSGYDEMNDWLTNQSGTNVNPQCAPRPGWSNQYWVHEKTLTLFTLKFGPGAGYDD